jgi:hypothetical protein
VHGLPPGAHRQRPQSTALSLNRNGEKKWK